MIPRARVCDAVARYVSRFDKVDATSSLVQMIRHSIKNIKYPMLPFNPASINPRRPVPDIVAERVATVISLFPDNKWIVPFPLTTKVEYYLGLDCTTEYDMRPSILCHTDYETVKTKPRLYESVLNGSAKNLAQREMLWAKYNPKAVRETILTDGEVLGMYMPEEKEHIYHNRSNTWGFKGVLIEPAPFGIPSYTHKYVLSEYVVLWPEVEAIMRTNGNSQLPPETLYRKLSKLVGGSKKFWSTVLIKKRVRYVIEKIKFACMWRFENVIFTTFGVHELRE